MSVRKVKRSSSSYFEDVYVCDICGAEFDESEAADYIGHMEKELARIRPPRFAEGDIVEVAGKQPVKGGKGIYMLEDVSSAWTGHEHVLNADGTGMTWYYRPRGTLRWFLSEEELLSCGARKVCTYDELDLFLRRWLARVGVRTEDGTEALFGWASMDFRERDLKVRLDFGEVLAAFNKEKTCE